MLHVFWPCKNKILLNYLRNLRSPITHVRIFLPQRIEFVYKKSMVSNLKFLFAILNLMNFYIWSPKMGLIPMTGSEIIDCVDFKSVFQHETYITYNKKLCIIGFSPYSYYKICSNLDIISFNECKFIVIDDFEI